MKKNISINISGIIFHIEEDGYETLRNYLDSINRYFSSYDDSKEIISDIENRIAEIFLSKLTNGKQIINTEDVDSLMATMGSIQDFEAIEEPESQQKERSKAKSEKSTEPKKLYRDNQRKILGGVAAGLANYFGIDPLWIRLILVIGVLGLDFFLWGAASGFFLIGYIIFWIVVPSSDNLEEDKEVKKLFRNPEDRVIAGVASGIAAYFGTEVTIIRLLFVITFFFGGAGLLIYFILWIIAPEAKTITDKMQMQGESVTLSNIESNIKESLNVKEGEEENLFVKILLFPFRLIATIVSGLGKALGPFMLFLVEAIRVIAGIILVITSAALLFSLLIAAGVLMGMFAGSEYISGELPLMMIRDSVPVFTTITAFFTLFIPALALALLGVTIIAKRKIIPSAVGWSMFAIWMISLLGLGLTLPNVVRQYKSEGTHRVTDYYDFNEKQGVLSLEEVGMDDYQQATLRLYGYEGDQYKLVRKYESRGSSRQDAIANAQMVNYNVKQQDSVLIFDSNLTFKDDAKFRGQSLEMELYIPYESKFHMTDDLRYIIRNTIYRSGYRPSQMEGNTWMFTESGLRCLTCEMYDDDEDDEYYYSDEYQKEFEVESFNGVAVGDDFIVDIRKGEEYKVVLSGEEIYIQEVDVINDGGLLRIGFDEEKFKIKKKNRGIEVEIVTPELDEVRVSGVCKTYINDFELSGLKLVCTGVSVTELDIQVNESLEIDLQDAAKMTLEGNGKNLQVRMEGAAELDAFYYEAENVEISARGACNAGVYASRSLDASSSGNTEILYKGNPETTTFDEGTGSTITEY
ncbi:MAG: PspC domain-containing protein [Cyclobacteriaceae bacterium]|nr:PspC domain-containing protein [Cyclobacteriaceae bacterium]